MKNLLFYAIGIFLLFSSQACHRNIYTPNAHNVPLFQEKGDVQMNLGFSNIQAALAVSDNVGVMFNTQLGTKGYSESILSIGEDQSTKRNLFELGGGYFNKLDSDFVFEVYAGAGLGKISFDNREDMVFDKYNAKSSRLFLQPGIGYSNDFIDLAFSLRFTHLNFHNADISEYVYNPEESYFTDNDLNQLDKHAYSFVEPAVTLRLGLKHVKLHMQLVWVRQINDSDINYHKGLANIGLHINLAKRYSQTTSVEL